ncbi:MAG: sodium/proline symporter [Phycisphaerales bacterium]|nr:sodium/proline symporter [Phycisphaerales bacterium]
MLLKVLGVGLYLAILLVIGVIASRKTRDVREYFAAGKKLGFWSVAFSARATGESAWLLLGLTGMGAAIGVQAFWVVLGELVGVGGAWLLMCRRFHRLTQRYDSITVPDYLESRFRDTSHMLRIVAATTLVVFVAIYVSAQIDATGTAFESFLGWNYFLGAAVGFGVVLAYIVSGGFVAVVWSDVFQGAMMFLGLVTLPIVGLIAAGGWEPVAAGIRAQDPGLLSIWGPDGLSAMTIATTLGLALIGLGFLGSPQVFVRFLALKSEREIPKGAAVAIVWTILADSGAVLIGIIGRHLLAGPGDELVQVLGQGGQNVLSMSVDLLLPAFLVGLYIAVVLAATMSTVDSLLVVASSAFVRDFWQRVRHPELSDRSLIGMSRIATFILAIAAFAIAMVVAITSEERTIFWFVIFGWSGIAATFCPTIILSLFWSGFTRRGALTAMVSGFACIPLFKFAAPAIPGVGPYFNGLEELAPSFLVSGTLGVVVSLLDKAGRERLADVRAELEAASTGEASQ